jgi:phosphinothricin acetyltransferase
MSGTIRLASAADAAAVQTIYAPYVRETAISFELSPPSVDAIGQRIARTLAAYPWLVCQDATGEVLGYAYGGRLAERAAYDWAAEVSVYVRQDHHRHGVGAALYTTLLAILKLQGYYRALAIIALPNEASVGLHRTLGFTDAGVLHRVGYKLGRWHDVGYMELSLQPDDRPPRPPRPLAAVLTEPAFAAALARGVARLRL